MAQDSYGAKNAPQYAGTGAPADAADLTQISNYAAKLGNRREGTTTERNNATGLDLWAGLQWYDTTLKQTFVYSGSGWVLQAGVAACLLTKSSSQSTAAGGYAFTDLTFDIEESDLYNMHAANAAAIVVPIAGVYQVSASYFGDTNAVFGIQLTRNGTQIEGTKRYAPAMGAGGLTSPEVSTSVRCSANDTLAVQASSSPGGQSITVAATFRPRFTATWVNP